MSPAGRLAGQVAVVTGGNGGIGLGIASGLARAGADVAIWARDEAKSAAAAEGLRRAHGDGRRFPAVRCDVSEPAEVQGALERTLDELGRLDACVANAGTVSRGGFLELSLEEWRRVMAVNLDGAFLTLQAAGRVMADAGEGGALVAVASTAAVHGAPVTAHYAAAKSGVLGLVRSAAVALARHQIRVNALLPGWTVTELARDGYESPRFREVTTTRTPARRWAEPAEFAAVAAYLCDKAHTFHTGDAVTVDGGYTVA